MTKRLKQLLPAIGAVAVLSVIILWMAGLFSEKIPPGMRSPATPIASDVVLAVAQETVTFESVPASIEAKQATLISSRIMARIEDIRVRAGDTVTKGQLLLRLEKTDLIAREQQAKEQVKALEVRLREADQNLTRITRLHEQGLIAVADLDQARANRNALQAQLASSRRAEDEVATAVSFAEIRSPINGRVVDRFAEPGDTAAPGVKLLSLYNPLSLRVEARVREELALSLTLGQALNVDIPALERSIVAEVEELVPAAEPGSRSFLVKASVSYQQALLPGMYARVMIPAGKKQQVLIPYDRVAEFGQLDVVWILENDGPVRRFVRLGKLIDNGESQRVEIVAGLNPDDKVLPVQ